MFERLWWEQAMWETPARWIPDNIYFDMDDTLTRTTHYFVNATRQHLVDIGDHEGVAQFNDLIFSGASRFDYPEKFIAINKLIMRKGDYIRDVQPTPLFNFFFLIPGNQPRGSHYGIITHRGPGKKRRRETARWFEKYTMAATLGQIHSISPHQHPSKLDYLKELHPDGNFLLVDDNPLYDTTVEHPYSKHIRIYDAYSKFDAYKNQQRVVEKNGLYIL